MASVAKIGYCRYEFLPILGSDTQINVPNNWTTPTDVLYARLINFTFDYSWNGNTCTISNIKWQPGYLTDTKTFQKYNLGGTNNTEFRQSGKLIISFGEQALALTSSNNLIWNSAGYTYADNITINSSSSYILANLKYEYSIASTSSVSGIKYYVEIKDVKIPKTSKYENNVVFTKEGIEELIQYIKHAEYSDTFNTPYLSTNQLRQGLQIPAENIIALGVNGLNLNDYIIPGRYYVPNSTYITNNNILNTPVASGFTLDVFGNYSSSYIIQIITTSTRDIYYRVRYGRYEKATSYIEGETYYRLVNGTYTTDNTVSVNTNFSSNTYYIYEYALRDWEKFATARNLTVLNHDLTINDNTGTTTTPAYSSLVLGNDTKVGQEGNSEGRITLYGTEKARHIIITDLNNDNGVYMSNNNEEYSYRYIHFQNYAGDQYLTHVAGTGTVGSATKPVYVDANGRIKACSFSIDNLGDYVKKTDGVTNVTWDSTNKKLTKTINGNTSDVVTASIIRTAIGLPNGNGDSGQFLKTDGNGNTSWATVSTTDTKNTAGASSQGNDSIYMIGAKGSSNSDSKTTYQSTSAYVTKDGYFYSTRVYNAVFNDYAEYRTTINLTPGHVVIDNDNGSLSCSSARLQPGAQVISDTFGHSMGETDTAKTPLAVAGRVLVYTYQPRENYHAGMAVCSAPDGTVDIMTREEIRDYPDCIIGIVSEIPQYETWGSDNVKVDGRIWIKVK